MMQRLMRLFLLVVILGFTGFVAGFHFAVSSAPKRIEYVLTYPTHSFTGTVTWSEKDFQALLQWERDGIFPRLGYDRDPPGWYEVEKKRRDIVVKPERIVTPEEFADPEFRRRLNR